MAKSSNAKEKPYYKVTSFERGLHIIELLAQHGDLTVSEMGRLIQQSRSVAHRFLATLHELGYVVKDKNSRYRLSLKLFELGNTLAPLAEVRALARPYMRRLADQYNETVNLGRLEQSAVITIDVVLGVAVLKFDSPIGSRSPAHTLAMGKAMLAYHSEEEQQAYLASVKLEALTPRTITDRETFLRELAVTHKRGYAIDKEEWANGLCCVSAPIFDHASEPIYAISVSGPSMRMTNDMIETISHPLREACQEVSHKLGSIRIP
jgi:DNA-binding IclR family transcriptional regulator